MTTIFALASGRVKSGVAVVRISGAMSYQILDSLTSRPVPVGSPKVRNLKSADGRHLDTALVLKFGRGASFTGEETVELHLHGSIATVNAVLAVLAAFEDTRLADPGEFTRRALENEKLDLAQVEGLADLIEAETEAQRVQALRVLSGALGAKVETWRRDLIRSAALLEATIDFADEDVPENVTPEVLHLLTVLSGSLDQEVRASAVSERIREGFEVAIVGAPNIGKSTLLNAIAGRDVAITSEIAGTTRDVLEVRLDLRGLPVTLLDTAGLRETTDPIETLGIERARKRASNSDLRVILLDPDNLVPILEPEPDDIVLVGKGDLYKGELPKVSGVTEEGITKLIDLLADRLETRATGAGTGIRMRHRLAIAEALDHIRAASDLLASQETKIEYAVENLYRALQALDSLIGRVDVEHILDEIFLSFCIGK
jgi:tRNA modification GTPase